MESFSIYSGALFLIEALLVYVVGGAVYRLYFSPIAKFPGPKLAALTLWYEFYYDVILRGQYTFHLRTLHAQYGPIVRINPYELHISDPAYYDTLYASSASGEKRDKWGWYTKQFGTAGAMFATPGHDQHKARRAALNRFFSTASVRRLQPVIGERVERLVSRIQELKGSKDEMLNASYVFAAFTNDVVMEYSYGHSDHRLDMKDWGPDYHDTVATSGKSGSLMKQMMWIFHIIDNLPAWIISRLSPALATIIRLRRAVEREITQIKAQPSSSYQNLSHPTLFHEILQSNLPESDKSVNRLRDEALIVIGAGTLTTSWALCVATYHLLSSPKILRKLKAELESAIPDANSEAPLPKLEKLPYLGAVVQEAIRLSYGVSSRMQRISPDKPLHFTDKGARKQWMIPPNTPVGMTSVLIHHDESIFPDSYTFLPERWIENPRLDRYMVSFSKGSRQCLGINLAYAEMYLCLAAIFRRFGSGGSDGVRFDGDEGTLELFETTLRDVEVAVDGFLPLPAEDSKGIRIKVMN